VYFQSPGQILVGDILVSTLHDGGIYVRKDGTPGAWEYLIVGIRKSPLSPLPNVRVFPRPWWLDVTIVILMKVSDVGDPYDTNIAAKLHLRSMLHRHGADASITNGWRAGGPAGAGR